MQKEWHTATKPTVKIHNIPYRNILYRTDQYRQVLMGKDSKFIRFCGIPVFRLMTG
jgi:hypothetical protein